MSIFQMQVEGYYGKVILPKSVFSQLRSAYFISGCTGSTKFMCANPDETRHLKSLGVKTIISDWYKIECESLHEQ